MPRVVALTAGFALCLATGAFAQVRYQPYRGVEATAPTPYGYPTLGGFLQPDETLGTSPSYVVTAYGNAGHVVRVVRRCQYPDGWNVTDFSRDVNGIPSGSDHVCPTSESNRVRARY